jgi:threonine/homoserine/homoserine lactone efflux protein
VTYSWTFLAVAITLVLIPGADFAVIVRNTVTGGRHVGAATTAGVSTAAALQGLLVSFGLAGFIVRAHPVFLAVKWAGIAYLAYLAATALLSAIRGDYPPAEEGQRRHSRLSGFRQGFLCNATNPKILVFYLALLPQFVGPAAPWWAWLVHAWTLPILGTCWCLLIVAGVDRARILLTRRNVRRTLDALTGAVLLSFCAKLATEG